MSPLAKQVIEALAKEEDNNLLAEVLDFYGYLKQKKINQNLSKWKDIEEDSPESDEVEIIRNYLESNQGTTSLNSLTAELGLDE